MTIFASGLTLNLTISPGDPRYALQKSFPELFPVQGHSQGGPAPLLGKRSSKTPFYTPNLEDILYFVTLFNIIIPKNFQPHFAWHNFMNQFDFLFMISKSFAGGFKSTNLVIPCLCIHENTKCFICIK